MEDNSTPGFLRSRWSNPNKMSAILLIIGGEVVQDFINPLFFAFVALSHYHCLHICKQPLESRAHMLMERMATVSIMELESIYKFSRSKGLARSTACQLCYSD